MQIPLQITFRGIPKSEAVEARIREKTNKLERFHSHIMSCRVAVEAEHQRHHQGNQYHIRIDITVPGKELVISREHHDNHAYEDIYVAIRDAFNAATRQLEEHARIKRGAVKNHNPKLNGTIVNLPPEQDSGFPESADNKEIHFLRDNLTGNETFYAEEEEDLGSQADIAQS